MIEKIKESWLAGFFKPGEYVESIHSIDLSSLKKKGVKALILDLDDTLIPRLEYRVPLTVYLWIEKLREDGFKLYLVSNGSRIPRLNHILDSLKIEGRALAFKPLPFVFNSVIKKMGATAKETAVIGDQIMTDVVGGNILGMHTILVKPVSEESSLIRIPMRMLEDQVRNFLDIRISS